MPSGPIVNSSRWSRAVSAKLTRELLAADSTCLTTARVTRYTSENRSSENRDRAASALVSGSSTLGQELARQQRHDDVTGKPRRHGIQASRSSLSSRWTSMSVAARIVAKIEAHPDLGAAPRRGQELRAVGECVDQRQADPQAVAGGASC